MYRYPFTYIYVCKFAHHNGTYFLTNNLSELQYVHVFLIIIKGLSTDFFTFTIGIAIGRLVGAILTPLFEGHFSKAALTKIIPSNAYH